MESYTFLLPNIIIFHNAEYKIHTRETKQQKKKTDIGPEIICKLMDSNVKMPLHYITSWP